MKILYEDNHIIVVLKNYNELVQKDITKDSNMVDDLKNYLKEKYNKPGNVYLGLVHRLDRPVGGIMIFAKTSKAASRLSLQFKNNEIQKNYIALVHNKAKKHDILTDYLLKDDNNTSKVVKKNIGKESILEYNLIKYIGNFSLIDINLLTGRHHQIRVQLSNAGFPIYGDQRYGIDFKKIQIHLYAYKLSFIHPVKKERMEFINYPEFSNLEKI